MGRLAGGAAGTVQAVVRVITRSYAYNAPAVPAVGLVCAHKQVLYVSEYQRPACTGKNPVQAGLEGVQVLQPPCTLLQGGYVPVGAPCTWKKTIPSRICTCGDLLGDPVPG